MRTYEVISVEEGISFHLTAEVLAEYIEEKFESQFEFIPMLQSSEDEGYLEVYLHTDTYETLGEEELTKLDELGITDSDCLETICSILNIKIETEDNHKDHDEQSGKKYRRLGKIMQDDLVSEFDCSPLSTTLLVPKKGAVIDITPFNQLTKMVKEIRQCLRIKVFSFSR